jgi:hypothetical protein
LAFQFSALLAQVSLDFRSWRYAHDNETPPSMEQTEVLLNFVDLRLPRSSVRDFEGCGRTASWRGPPAARNHTPLLQPSEQQLAE